MHAGTAKGYWKCAGFHGGLPPFLVLAGRRLNAMTNKMVALPEALAHFKTDAVEATPGSPVQLGQFIEADYRAWRNVVKTQDLKIE